MARGFFATLQQQSRRAERERIRRSRIHEREEAARQRQQLRDQKLHERLQKKLERASAAERKRLDKEEHDEAMEAKAEELNIALEDVYSEIDSLLSETLGKDDYVDLNTLRAAAQHPPFDRTDLEVPLPAPAEIMDPEKPVLALPEAPHGLAALFGKSKHAKAVEVAQEAYARELALWDAQCKDVERRRHEAKAIRDQADLQRLEKLAAEKERYRMECQAREAEVAEQNHKLDELIANLGYGTTEAIQDYISIVLSNSVYPDSFPITHDFDFDATTAELRLRVVVPGPDKLPKIKAYKYAKAADEITSSELSQKQCRDRYAGAVYQVALRSFHEVFEADRRALIKTISLEVGTNTVDPATGLNANIPFVIAAAERDTFLSFNLAAVVPLQTLTRLGASVSKNPYELVAAEREGIRRA